MGPAQFENHPTPLGLSPLGIGAVVIIRRVLAEHDALFTGGCTPFYSPRQWKERGEWHAIGGEPTGVVLVVCHDGGDMSHYGGVPKLWAALDAALSAGGYRVNYGEHWWTYITHTDAINS